MNLEFDTWPAGAHDRAVLLAQDIVGTGPANVDHVNQLVRILQRTELVDYPETDVRSFASSVLDACGHPDAVREESMSTQLSRLRDATETTANVAAGLYDPLLQVYEGLRAHLGGQLAALPEGGGSSRDDRRSLLVALGSLLYVDDHEPFTSPIPIFANPRTVARPTGEQRPLAGDLVLDIEFISTGLLVIELWNRVHAHLDDLGAEGLSDALDGLPDPMRTPDFLSLLEGSSSLVTDGSCWDAIVGMTVVRYLTNAIIAANSTDANTGDLARVEHNANSAGTSPGSPEALAALRESLRAAIEPP